jgi:hypothetical protein
MGKCKEDLQKERVAVPAEVTLTLRTTMDDRTGPALRSLERLHNGKRFMLHPFLPSALLLACVQIPNNSLQIPTEIVAPSTSHTACVVTNSEKNVRAHGPAKSREQYVGWRETDESYEKCDLADGATGPRAAGPTDSVDTYMYQGRQRR